MSSSLQLLTSSKNGQICWQKKKKVTTEGMSKHKSYNKISKAGHVLKVQHGVFKMWILGQTTPYMCDMFGSAF